MITDSASTLSPAMPTGRIKGATDMIRQIGEAIYLLDLTIDQWNEQLKRAQPHRFGRVLVRFMRNKYALIEGEKIYDVEPVVGRMVQLKSGAWRFFKLTAKDRYEHLRDLRVGQSLTSDPLVVRLIDGIEDLLKQRNSMLEVLISLRKGMPGKIAAIHAACDRRGEQAIDLSRRVKLDWTQGAAAAEEQIKAQRRERYQRHKLEKSLDQQ